MPAAADPTPAQPDSTRERILTASLRLFAERGYRGTTIADIEEAAGLSPGSGGLYAHFHSKHELLAAAIGRSIALTEAACKEVYATAGYESSARNLPNTTLKSDNVFGDDGGIYQLATMSGSVSAGYAAALNVTI